MNITASNTTTEWRAKDLEFDVSENSEGVTEKFGIIIPDSAEKITVEITYVELEDGLYWDKSGEFFSFLVNSKDGIFLTDANGDRILETKTKPSKQKKSASPILLAISVIAIIVGIIAASSGSLGNTDTPNINVESTTHPSAFTTPPITFTTAPTSATTATTAATRPTSGTTATTVAPRPFPTGEVIVDIDFGSDGSVTDKYGTADVTLVGGAAIYDKDVTFNGITKPMPGIHASSRGQSGTLTFMGFSPDDMDALYNGEQGFSFEVFYVNRFKSGTQGILCSTEYCGLGIAETANGVPGFCVYGTSNRSYHYTRDIKVTSSSTNLTHIISTAKYVPSENAVHTAVYVNGKLVNEGLIHGKIYITDNRYLPYVNQLSICNDIGPIGFPTSDCTVVDIKIYSYALNASEVTTVFNDAASLFTAPIEKGEYVDVDFNADGTITDKHGNASFQNIGTPIVETVTVTHNGISIEVPALHITSRGSFVVGMFDKLNTTEKMQDMFNQGFSVEVFYLDNSTINAGVFCMTENQSGFGVAHNRAKNAPYFITGNGKSWNSAFSTAVSDNELVHVVGVYDAEAKKHSIYVNGVDVSDRTVHPGENVPGVQAIDQSVTDKDGIALFNTFCLGAELASAQYNRYDFTADDLTIIDAKFYIGALTSDEVTEAYKEATSAFKSPESDPSELVIFLDPGHGGKDPGVMREYDFDGEGTNYENTTYKEADISLAVALKAKAKLEALGYQVIISRTGDTFVEVADRPAAALKVNAAMFISIHVNSASGDFAKGFEAYYSGKTGLGYDAKAFADLFTKEFAEILDIPNSNKPEEPAYPNMTIRGTKADTDLYTNGIAVLNQKESLMPSTLLELGFLSNENDAFMLQGTYWQNFAAQAIADAVVAAHNAGIYKK
jgi:N-acetylmuramoyl-L-alanine amidase